MGSAKTILGQMFGTRRLNANEDGEVMLGYDLYSSALANILTEPSLSMPITVGLYAKWGSGRYKKNCFFNHHHYIVHYIPMFIVYAYLYLMYRKKLSSGQAKR